MVDITWLVVEAGTITNAIVGDAATPAAFPDAILVDKASAPADAWIGWSYDGGAFHAPAPVALAVPQSITRLQGRMALFNAELLAQVEAAVNTAGGATAIWYADAQTWERNNPILMQLAAALSLTSAQIDALFIAAAQIT